MKNKIFYLGFLGFLGFKSLFYFKSGDITDLYYLPYLAFFGNFFISRINSGIVDEMYLENKKTAEAFLGRLMLILVSITYIISVFLPDIPLTPVIGAVMCISIFSYCVKFYLLERNNG